MSLRKPAAQSKSEPPNLLDEAEQDEIIRNLESEIAKQSKLWRVIFCALCLFSAVVATAVWRHNEDLLCDFFGSTLCINLGVSGQNAVMVAIVTSFVVLSACFSGCVRKFESFLWFVAFAAATGATAALLASVSVYTTHPGTLCVALVPFGVCFVCGFVLKEIQQSYEPELQRLKEAKYRFKAL